ncbi:MAG: metalloregulator ArsR/SmtB family transcription factor [Trueperaceae bacterium]|nr:metalloregulator ArsR/SmtB family transcription factor [Trueperaceae bacterium]
MVEATLVESFEAQAQAFKALGEPTRLRILAHLQAGESCACEVQQALDVPANLLSHHLKVLREAGLVHGTRRGRWIDYRIEPTALALLASVLTAVAERPAPTRCATGLDRTAAA